ncbi:MAG: formylglycine-generating enzyme family protein [Gemmatimonadaceae bacterium]
MRSRLCLALVVTSLVVPAQAQAAGIGARTPPGGTSGMAWIEAGWYRPLYAPTTAPRVRVGSFALDRLPVTRREYQRFVGAHPEWRRGAVRAELAGPGYLADWPTASSAGDASDLDRPVASVSWFAATAFCASHGKRLPGLHEWEYAASASETDRHAASDPAFRRRLLALYGARQPGRPAKVGSTFRNAFGVSDLHGLVWEWTHDFDLTARADATRADGKATPEHHLYCASSAIGVTDPANYPAFARFAVRAGLNTRSTVSGVGFRCAGDRAS